MCGSRSRGDPENLYTANGDVSGAARDDVSGVASGDISGVASGDISGVASDVGGAT